MESIFCDNTKNIFSIEFSAEQLFSEGEHLKIHSNDDERLADIDTQAAIKLEPKKRTARNVRRHLTVENLGGQRGFQSIENYFNDIKFKGRNFEIHDADEIMRRLQHWAHRLHPTYNFDDILSHIERLGKKKLLQVHMSRYRLGMLENINAPSGENEAPENAMEVVEESYDEFDALLGEQIAICKLDAHQHSRRDESTKSNYLTTSNGIASPPSSLSLFQNSKNDTLLPSLTTEPHAKQSFSLSNVAESNKIKEL